MKTRKQRISLVVGVLIGVVVGVVVGETIFGLWITPKLPKPVMKFSYSCLPKNYFADYYMTNNYSDRLSFIDGKLSYPTCDEGEVVRVSIVQGHMENQESPVFVEDK